MASIFTKIIEGELPAHFVYEDELCVAFLTVEPICDGHLMVIPRQEVDHWLDLPPQLLSHLMTVSQRIGQALQDEFDSEKVGMMIVGLEVPHTHIHLTPINAMRDMDFAKARPAEQEHLAEVADRVRAAVERQGPLSA